MKTIPMESSSSKSLTDEPLVAIGIGMGRTGTISLKRALETLLGQPCYHSYEIMQRHREHIPLWREIFEELQVNPDAKISVEKLNRIFKGYCASTDHPVCALYEQLMEIYPGAKFILTTRSSRSWIESLRATVMPHKPHFPPNFIGRLSERIMLGAGFLYTNTLSFRYTLGWDVNIDDDEECVWAFEARTQRIIETIPADRLLVFRVEEGWEPLCQFLQLPVPNMPFPRSNTREDMFAMFDSLRRRRNIAMGLAIAILIIVVALVIILPASLVR